MDDDKINGSRNARQRSIEKSALRLSNMRLHKFPAPSPSVGPELLPRPIIVAAMPGATAAASTRRKRFQCMVLFLISFLLLNALAFHSLYVSNGSSSFNPQRKFHHQLQQQQHAHAESDPLFRTRKYMKKPGRYYPGQGHQDDKSGREHRRCLVLWPRIPVERVDRSPSSSSSDKKVMSAIKELLKLRYDVDVMFWEDEFDAEAKKALKDLGVTRILGPYKNTIVSRHPATDLNGYGVVFTWIWPDPRLLFWLLDTVRYLKDINGATRLVSFLDSPGVSYEILSERVRAAKLLVTNDEIKGWILRNRPHQLLGNDVVDLPDEDHKLEAHGRTVRDLLTLETSLYVLSSVVVGTTSEAIGMLRLMVPATPSLLFEHFDEKSLTFKKGLKATLDAVNKAKVHILVSGNAKRNGGAATAQNWHVVHSLKSRGFEVSVEGEFEPRIEGVANYHKNFGTDPLPTGFQYDAVLRQSWPPDLSAPPLQTCYTGCRVAQILAFEYGTLPEEWVKQILKDSDEVWGPSMYSARVLIDSGIPPSRVRTVSRGLDCEELDIWEQRLGGASPLPGSAELKGEESKENKVLFVFSGGLTPRKGVEILLQEWSNLFCTQDLSSAGKNSPLRAKVRLILHTTYENGYSRQEVEEMAEIIRKCKNVEWRRNVWLDRNDYMQMIGGSDVFVAPFRSESFGLPMVEAMAMGLRIVASSGGTSTDDFLSEMNGYPVASSNIACRHYPCSGGTELCIFHPCQGRKCTCKSLVQPPTWHEVDRVDFRVKLIEALNDVTAIHLESDPTKKASRSSSKGRGMDLSTQAHARSSVRKKFCWDVRVTEEYVDSVRAMIARLQRPKD